MAQSYQPAHPEQEGANPKMITYVGRLVASHVLAAATPTPTPTPVGAGIVPGAGTQPPPVNFTGIGTLIAADIMPILIMIGAAVVTGLGLAGKLSKVFHTSGVIFLGVGLLAFAGIAHWWGPAAVSAIFGAGN